MNTVRQHFYIMAAWLLFVATGVSAQTYTQLWAKVKQAQQKDLPQTALQHVRTIEQRAQQEQAYGQLMQASLMAAKLMNAVEPDSLLPAVQRLEQQEQNAPNVALQAVYSTVLSQVYQENNSLSDNWQERSEYYRQRATAHPAELAQVKAADYDPFVVSGKDSQLFGNDLLSVVGMELDAWQWMHDYYRQTTNRRAACLTAAEVIDRDNEHSPQQRIAIIDSLIAVYGDIPECCELAIIRYALMERADFSARQQYEWLVESVHRWPTWKRSNALSNALSSMTNPTFNAYVEKNVAEVNRPQTVRLRQLRHLTSLTMRVYRTTLKGDTDLRPSVRDDYQKMKSGLTELTALRRTLTFSGHPEYEYFNDSTELAALQPGVYMLEFSTEPGTAVERLLYFVSDLRVISQAQPNNKVRYVVVNATTGQPVNGATLRLTWTEGWRQPKKTEIHKCNNQGEAIVNSKDRGTEAFAYTKKDNYSPAVNLYGRYSYYERDYHNSHTSLFTDRSIYRPGQTVHVAAIVWREVSATDNAAVSGKKLVFELRDANYKKIAEQSAVTDSYGKCDATFTLPQGLLNGRFSIRTSGASTSFRVEDYKRPTFQVEFQDYQQSYQAGDTVRVQGKAVTYAGVPVQGARVHYKVQRRVAYWWMSYSRYWQYGTIGRNTDSEPLYEGDAVTADDGTFTAVMPMVLPAAWLGQTMFYHIVADADVTDQGGETHSGSVSLPLGSKSTTLVCNLPEKVRRDQLKTVTFGRRNAAGNEISGEVQYRLDGGAWQTVAANEAVSTESWTLPSGKHTVEAVCEQDSVRASFVVFALDDTKPATTTHDWFYASHARFPNSGEPVTIQVGSSDEDLHIVYSIFAGNQVIESGVTKQDASLLNRKFTYQEQYGNGLLLTYAWVKDGQCYRHEHTIARPMPDKQLRMKWTTFRDRLTPGQQEQWTLHITKPDGTPADASLMAVLYDKSLDQLQSHGWYFNPSVFHSMPSTRWSWSEGSWLQANGSGKYKYLNVNALDYSHFNHDVYPERFAIFVRGRSLMKSAQLGSVPVAMAAEAPMEASMAETAEAVATNDMLSKEIKGVAMDEAAVEEESASGTSVQIRENLNETAFCYPALTTDSNGSVAIRFTLPESLTTWRFLGVANTTDMLYGNITGEAVASKEVMMMPNMPRFVRMGDEAQLTGRIINTSDHTVSGTALLQLLSADSNELVMQQEMDFSVDGGQTSAVTFSVPTTQFSESLLVCKMMVQGDGFSDGEQHYLPVLPDYEMVTRTVPVTQHEPGVKTIRLSSLFPTGTQQQKLTVEYTNNPAWLMVQALPTIGQPTEWSAISLAAAYYSNALAQKLMDNTPHIQQVFSQWQRESDQQSLQSQLQKNQELKDLILNETPWVNDADRETEQKQRLADFFDQNALDYRLTNTLGKLKKLQRADGSFSWYPDMPGSTMMTVAIQEMLSRLNVMTGSERSTREMQDKAKKFIGNEMKELVENMKKEEKKGHKPTFPSFTALRWLYICAIDDQELSKDMRATNDYLIALLKKDIKRQTIYEKAMTAVVLHQHGDKKMAQEYVKSLKEYTVYTEEMGRYYSTRRAGYSWYDYKIPTEVAAIEAISKVAPDDVKTVDEMRRWLLQEKRTQQWDTPISSVNAIYAFFGGSLCDAKAQQTLDTQRPQTVIAIDDKPLEMPKATAGIGYVKTAVEAPKGQQLTMTKSSEGTSWGAVYAQFRQKTAQVEASQGGITVKREIIAPKTLKVGDRIKVRITIVTSRDLDFVQLCDRRAACMEPVKQVSGYRNGAYVSPKDYATNYYYCGLAKGKHVMETEYYIDRAGCYQTGTCTVQCAYSPEFRATAPSQELRINN